MYEAAAIANKVVAEGFYVVVSTKCPTEVVSQLESLPTSKQVSSTRIRLAFSFDWPSRLDTVLKRRGSCSKDLFGELLDRNCRSRSNALHFRNYFVILYNSKEGYHMLLILVFHSVSCYFLDWPLQNISAIDNRRQES